MATQDGRAVQVVDAVDLVVEAAVHQAINNWDRESAQLFSLIQRQRKADKFNQYKGGKMEFSEELKQIVRETKGVWGVKLPQDGYRSLLDETKTYMRPEYEACLMEMTGRPKVEDWPKWAGCVTQDMDGSWTAWMHQDQAEAIDEEWYEKPEYDSEVESKIGWGSAVNWKESLMTRGEALEREHIISCKPVLQHLKQASGFTGAAEKAGQEAVIMGASNKYYWFRNGDLPPVGEKVVVFAGSRHLLYGHDVIGKTGTVAATYTSANGFPVVVVEYNSAGYCFDLNCVYPEGFDIDDLHHQVLTIMHIDDALKDSGIEQFGQTIGMALAKSGCRHHPELAE